MNQNQNIGLLLSRISNEGDEKAFKQLFELFAGRLYQFAYSFLKNKPVAEEAVSDVFFKIWLNRQSLVNIQNIKAYLFKATYHTSLNYLDQENRKKAISLEDVEVNIGVDYICPETTLINKELKEIIDKSIESLPARCKLIYRMAKVEQMKYKEIAETLDISVKTIDNQLSVAIKKIGEAIRAYLEHHEHDKQFLILFSLFIPDSKKEEFFSASF
ncbi:MAG: RNA polymerase sigma-70 factor [Prolixibacteraceae bacterium]